jgi:hypothetical protein
MHPVGASTRRRNNTIESDTQADAINSSRFVRRRRAAPILTLLLLSPLVAEVLFGATHITTLFIFVPQIDTRGCGTLIIRYLVRRYHRGWMAVVLLGIAFVMAEECVIQQTSLAPLVGVDPDHAYGRALGVNWVYLLWALGYESIWAVAPGRIPIAWPSSSACSQRACWQGSESAASFGRSTTSAS